ncbi:MAG TPA: beta-phosphoglucomutase family hydrolase [Acidimicrobiia bacterium]|nr:beta-phosphoglucomutase family hydrolase [Acidimicrobiia bacterium]
MVDWKLYQAVLFDLDGVLTDTARVHAKAWKETFDEFLETKDQPPFTIEGDYRKFVDGRPRYQGVATFFASRGIALPWGEPSDGPDEETICGVGNRKNELVNQLIATDGVSVYPGSRRLIEYLAALNLKMGVVTSSANARTVLAGAKLETFFRVRVDGELAAELGLQGKPHPDPFLKAAALLGVDPGDAVVLEDATSGVAAGKAGGFGLVVGVNRHDDAQALMDAGADLVVDDLGALVG